MCSSVIEVDGRKLACRKCNECITARKNGWVARAMAEKATSAETFSVTLTYNDETQENRDGARNFEYRHVKALLWRLRRSIFYATGQRSALRFICAGELGSDKGRCHYHILLFCNVDIFQHGEYTAWPTGKPVPERWQKITKGKRKRRLNWSLWPHGFVTFQEPDQWGVEYAIAYALKDQFNIVSAAGTMRETKVSRVASGLFRMSKRPPIGFPFLDQYLARIEETGHLPISTRVKVPNYKGYWYPTGKLREIFLDRLRMANELHKAKYGKDAAQWSTLVNSVKDSDSDYERLVYGTEEEEKKWEEECDDFNAAILLRTKEIRAAQRDAQTRRRCGSLKACQRCLNSLSDQDFDKAKRFYAAKLREHGGNADAAEKQYRQENRPNPFCNFRELSTVKRVFKKGA